MHDTGNLKKIKNMDLEQDQEEGRRRFTLGPAGPPLHSGVFVVLQSVQNFKLLFSFMMILIQAMISAAKARHKLWVGMYC